MKCYRFITKRSDRHEILGVHEVWLDLGVFGRTVRTALIGLDSFVGRLGLSNGWAVNREATLTYLSYNPLGIFEQI